MAWLTRRWRLTLGLAGVLLLLILLAAVAVAAHVLAPVAPWSIRRLMETVWSAIGTSHLAPVGLSIFRWLLFFVVGGAIVLFVRGLLQTEAEPGLSDLARCAQTIRQRLGVRHITMGHTHDADLEPIGKQGEEYFNTGTWTKVFSEKQQLLREESELVFLQALRRPDGLLVKLLKWNDGAREPRLVKLFD